MAFLVGTDEAGYGPNLGPLVISASVWQVPDGPRPHDLYRRLEAAVSPSPGGPRGRAPRVAIADSKAFTTGPGVAAPGARPLGRLVGRCGAKRAEAGH